MEAVIKERFNAQIMEEAGQRYGVVLDKNNALDGFESFIYEFEKDGSAYILRIAHSQRRTEALIQGEVDWINYLAAGGVGVAQAVLSENGRFVEPIDDGKNGHFLATAFVKAKGDTAWAMEKSDATLWLEYGRLLGKIHTLSKVYTPSNPEWKRPLWDDPIMRLDNWLPDDQKLVQQHADELIHYLQALPIDSDSYGLIHQDAHMGNFFVDEAYNITLFDFDDCAYGHFVYDIAMVLFYAITNHPKAAVFAVEFMEPFMRGYKQENSLDPKWLAEIPYFLKYREIDLYAAIHRSFDMEQMPAESWVGKFMNGRQQRIEDDVPYLDMQPLHDAHIL